MGSRARRPCHTKFDAFYQPVKPVSIAGRPAVSYLSKNTASGWAGLA